MEIIQHKFLSFVFQDFVIPIIESVRSSAHLHESYRTLRDGCLDGAVPGTSCQATIAPSLRDISQWARGEKSPNLTLCKRPTCKTSRLNSR